MNLLKNYTQSQISKKAGIYQILISGRSYVGSSIHLNIRLKEHYGNLKHNNHPNRYLQRTFNKHGNENLYFVILFEFKERPLKKVLLEQEKYYIDLLQPEFNSKLDPVTEFNSILQSKIVYQYDLDGNFMKEWVSCSEAGRVLNINSSSISSVARENLMSAGKFLWSYDKKKTLNLYQNNSKFAKIKTLYVFDKQQNFLRYYDSVADCARNLFPNEDSEAYSGTMAFYAKLKLPWKGYYYSYTEKGNIWKENQRIFEVDQFDLNDNFLKTWNSWGEIKKFFNMKESFNLISSRQYTNTTKTQPVYNFRWKKHNWAT